MANFILSDVLGNLKEMGISFKNMKLNPVHLSTLFDLIEKGEISLKIAKQILPDILKTGEEVEKIVEAKGLKQISDTSELETIVSDIVEKHPNSIQEYREGKTKVIGFFVGQVMKATGGKANPQMVNQLIRKKLDSLK
jgi:aspartyl-tRNA(Asn)/glutamyl-tRNA(Gln) amidotransferase subunit B